MDTSNWQRAHFIDAYYVLDGWLVRANRVQSHADRIVLATTNDYRPDIKIFLLCCRQAASSQRQQTSAFLSVVLASWMTAQGRTAPVARRQRRPTDASDLELFGKIKSIVYFDAKVANRTLELGVAQQATQPCRMRAYCLVH